MEVARLLAAEGIDPQIEAHYRLITSVKKTTKIHCHDFFELFLILKGSVIHCINGKRELLSENTLVFIRENDVHYYEEAGEEDCQFINLSFYKHAVYSLFDYLGDGFPRSKLLDPAYPPMVVLSGPERDYVRYRLDNLTLIPQTDKLLLKAEFRALLAELLSRYVMEAVSHHPGDLPDWLRLVCAELKKKEHFVEGMPALLRLSGRTHSYLCRVFKKHLGIQPVEYINRLRLTYAENLLLHTDMEIVDICLEVGFENISYFYQLFKRHYRVTPHKLRSSNRLRMQGSGIKHSYAGLT
ncbi:MAG: AraC family transcriptional regulator [Paenibacillaceae bacterium]|nr:AraC family transcriptional regulator [Paenibacillaceae bacterium]